MRYEKIKTIKGIDAYDNIPETCIEAVEALERFLICEAQNIKGEPSDKTIENHFRICKEQIRQLHENGVIHPDGIMRLMDKIEKQRIRKRAKQESKRIRRG